MTGLALGLALGLTPGPPCPSSAEALEIGVYRHIQHIAICMEKGDTPSTEATSHWLAMQRLKQLDYKITNTEARTYTPAARRLLMDAIRAHRGRKTPSPEHEEVLSSFPWYSPIESYTDQNLNALDRENLEKLTHPPTASPPPARQRDPAVRETRGCLGGYGCQAVRAPAQFLFWLLPAGLISSRRRAVEKPSARKRRAARPRQA